MDVSQEAEEERAAIKEYCGNLTREEADIQAARDYDKLRNCLAQDLLKKPLLERQDFLKLFAKKHKKSAVEDLKSRMQKLYVKRVNQ